MTKFKVGDVVERAVAVGCNGLPSGVHGVVSSVGFGAVTIKGYGDWQHIVESLRLVVEQDDPLPPAPESVRYNDEYSDRFAYKQTWLDVKQDGNQIYIETGQYGECKGVGMVLSPDAALQLAHDLNRMANEIKRKEKQHA